jgi:ubiquinone/menaquinone biosynthesis C-methylase UbiE
MMVMLSNEERQRRTDRLRRLYDTQAGRYDKGMLWFERHLFGEENRPWVCSRAHGDVLEVAIGTGLNLPYYRRDIQLTGLDLSPAMLDIASRRADELGRAVVLHEGDAHELPYDDDSFDSVVCTFSLCNIPDLDRAVAEMKRVLKPGGKLLLVDHIRSSIQPIYWLQKAIEFLSVRLQGEHFTRRPLESAMRHGFRTLEQERFRWGIVERVCAAK